MIGSMKTIGFVSDTHGTLDPAAYAALADSDVIIHAGDIGRPSVLTELRCLAPTIAVLGNNDFDEYGPAVGRFAHPVIDGVRFLVAHKPADVLIGFNGCPGLAAGDPIPQVRMHGHTHVPKLVADAEARPADVLINPGAVFRSRSEMGRTVGKMLVEDGRILGARIETLGGSPLASMGEPF